MKLGLLTAALPGMPLSGTGKLGGGKRIWHAGSSVLAARVKATAATAA